MNYIRKYILKFDSRPVYCGSNEGPVCAQDNEY